MSEPTTKLCDLCAWPVSGITGAFMSTEEINLYVQELCNLGYTRIAFGFHTMLELAKIKHAIVPVMYPGVDHYVHQLWCDNDAAYLCVIGDTMSFDLRLFALQEHKRDPMFVDACRSIMMLNPDDNRAVVRFFESKFDERCVYENRHRHNKV